ncbi:MAG: cyclic nucleotide-binding domain-containing protein [Verrucomicrobia bacterium]|nr:cyclic nucleotide-binding domain-containing protein [Verrucomicrobiota bacterium]
MSDPDPMQLAETERKRFKAGELILKQGDLGYNAYRILNGEVEVFFSRGGERVALGRLGAGEIFGEMGMIEDRPRSATVQAVVPTEVAVVTPQAFNQIILHQPEQLVPYLKSFFERLRRANELSSPIALPAPGVESSSAMSGSSPAPEPGTVRLTARTEILRQRILKASLVVHKFPFRIGRWSENFQADVFVSNDLLIRDEAPFQVSRNHCAIEREGDHYCILDRGSAFGTRVNHERIGGVESRMVVALHRGENEILLGNDDSPYRFQVIV